MRNYLIECMSDGIWHAGIEYLPLGASDRLAQAAYDAIPAEISARLLIKIPETSLRQLAYVQRLEAEITRLHEAAAAGSATSQD